MILLVLEVIIRWFSDNAEVQGMAMAYLLWVLPSFLPLSALLYLNTVYSATGRPMVSLRYTCLRVVLLLVPGAWLLMQFFEVQGIFMGAALANVVSGLIAYVVFKRGWGKVTSIAS